mgnify:CR=1 FL=1
MPLYTTKDPVKRAQHIANHKEKEHTGKLIKMEN